MPARHTPPRDRKPKTCAARDRRKRANTRTNRSVLCPGPRPAISSSRRDPVLDRRVRREQLADLLARPERVGDHQVRLIGQLRLRRQRRLLHPALILRSALANDSGSPVSSAPDWSAWYSRDRDTASRITVAAIGPSSETRRIAKGFVPPSRLPPNMLAKNARLASAVITDGHRAGHTRDQDVAVVHVATAHGPAPRAARAR